MWPQAGPGVEKRQRQGAAPQGVSSLFSEQLCLLLLSLPSIRLQILQPLNADLRQLSRELSWHWGCITELSCAEASSALV